MRPLQHLAPFALGAALVLLTGAALQQQPGAPARARQEQQQIPVEYINNGRILSSAVRAGTTLYLSGQLGTSGERGIGPETRTALGRVKTLLEDNGATMDDVVKCTVFLADFAEWGAMNEVYTTFFQKHRPTRSAVAVSGLSGDARVEIECTAVMGARNAD